jgi:Fic family protein
MTWNWQQNQWPNFEYRSRDMEKLEQTFLKQSGLLLGAYLHINPTLSMSELG